MSGMSTGQVRRLFAQEAEVRLAELGRLLLQLEQNVQDESLVRSIFRELHTLKGSAAVAGLDEVSHLAHGFEQLVEDVQNGRKPVTAAVIDTLLRGADELSTAVFATEPDEQAHELGVQTDSPSSGVPVGGSAVIMVPVERLDELTRLVGETTSAHLRVGRLLKDRFDVDPATCPEFNELSRSLNDLHDRTMRTQMVPVSTITDQLARAVRDLARSQGKEVRWEIQGADTELDRSVLHQLSDSLTHLVRNAVDHGIETPAEREHAGKSRQAVLRLHAMQLGSEVIIAVTDDGRGIDVDRVEREASLRGVQTEGLSRDDLIALSFQPGLSTADFVTDVSGRGVGLDVVRANVAAAHGRVEVHSEPGSGTEFRIIVPITMAVLRCLLVEAGGQRFALPFHRVLLTRDHESSDVAHAEGREMVWFDGQPLPVGTLAEAIGLPQDRGPSGPVVVLSDTSRRHAFTVDRLIGQRDVVVKALGSMLPHLPEIAGASVEADGSILVVLDPPGLIERARQSSHSPVSSAVEDSGVARPRVLVVDDALVVRELQRAILQRAGFDVRVAADGQQALAELAEQPSDLVVTDIEMPRMDGFALTEAIRAHPTLANIPVLIVSSRDSDADRRRGLDAGADGYITKSSFDESGLLTAVNRLLGTHA
ncbi:two-component system, chemotaxis family, sensor kinase CheA [Marmoricola sp. URHA0025 HA25]